jgi:type IV pilus assembly protein PilW
LNNSNLFSFGKPRQSDAGGFTLVELMITLAMSGIIVAAVYAAYIVQQKSYYSQGQVVEMQQNLRAALEMMTGDIRMALYDPGGGAGADIPVATAYQLQVRMDLNSDGDYGDDNEDVSLGFSAADDADDDGVADGGRAALRRNDQSIAENIQAVEFYYTLKDGSKEADPDAAGKLDEIQAVTISILAVAALRDAKYTNDQSYTTASGQVWPGGGDNFRRRLLTHTVTIRNQGL